MTSAEQKAYYAANAAKGKKFEQAQDENLLKSIRDRGDAAKKGMEEGRMDAMGNAYKKGGKIMKMVKEPMEPMSGPDMKRHDDFISKHEEGEFKHHKNEFKKHAAGHKHHMDHVEAMCGGGMAKGKK